MKLRVVTIGKPALSFYKAGIDEYLKRLKRYGGVAVQMLRDGGRGAAVQSADLLAETEGDYRIALDERGVDLTTADFVEMIESLEVRGDVKQVSFLIGGADGHVAALRKKAHKVVRLSALTMQHEQGLLVLVEQLYRVRTIQAGSPYHR